MDIIFRIEADRLPIAPRDRDDVRVFVFDRLKERLGSSPQTVNRRIVMARNRDIRFIGPDMLQRPLRREGVQK